MRKAARVTYESRLWKIWRAIITPGTCYYCASMNGRILAVDDPRIAEIPVHPNCKCHVEAMTAIAVGTATKAGSEGVDLYAENAADQLREQFRKLEGAGELNDFDDIYSPDEMLFESVKDEIDNNSELIYSTEER